MDDLDCHRILGTDPDASPRELRAAYRSLARALHPDRFAGADRSTRDRARESMSRLNRAYRHLTDRRTSDEGTIRIMEPELVARAALARFEDDLRGSVPRLRATAPRRRRAGDATAFLLSTGAGRRHVVVHVRGRLDTKGLRRELRSLARLSSRNRLPSLPGPRPVVFLLVGWLERSGPLRRLLRRYRRASARRPRLPEVVLVDVGRWCTFPEGEPLPRRLRALRR